MKVAILAIGDEVVCGRTVNTNAAYLSKILESNHFRVVKHLTCLDDMDAIASALDFLYEDAELIFTIGGIGPTDDDLTKEAVAKYFSEELILYPEVVKVIKNYFSRQGLTMPENNRQQAYFIKGSKIIPNENGTAPGMIFEKEDQMIVVLPGPPRELIPMVENTVLPYLKDKENEWVLKEQYRLMNIGESHVMERIGSILDKYSRLKIVTYASVGRIDLIVSTNNKDDGVMFKEACHKITEALHEFMIDEIDRTIQEVIVHRLIEKGYTIAVAESLTGGMLTSMIVDVPGSSKVLNEAFVTYSNESKVKYLGVNEKSLQEKGAVSEEVAREMAIGVAKASGATIGISTTGIAGPGGGTDRKPVGLVYMAISMDGETKVYRRVFSGNREKVRQKTCYTILFHLYKEYLQG